MELTCEIRSVNHRFFEFSARVPRQYSFLEDKLKGLVQSRVFRGKIDLFLTVNQLNMPGTVITVNHTVAKGYISALREIGEQYGLPHTVTAEQVARYPDVLTISKEPEDEEALWEQVGRAATAALEQFIHMRETEGARMKADILNRCGVLEAKVAFVESQSPKTVQAYRERLEERVRELLDSAEADEQRLLTETAVFADKIAVAEETVRLRSHLSQMRELLDAPDPVGRKLDFLVQECNRETNTIGSKAQDVEITRAVLDMKSEIEKIREQVQNIE